MTNGENRIAIAGLAVSGSRREIEFSILSTDGAASSVRVSLFLPARCRSRRPTLSIRLEP